MLSVNPHAPTKGREKGGEGRETYRLNIKSFTNNTNYTKNVNNKTNKAKCTKSTLSFLELGVRRWRPASSCRAAPGSPRMVSAVDGNWTQECTDQNVHQDGRQDKEQSPLQQLAMDKERERPS